MTRYKVMCWQEIRIKESDGGITYEGEWVPYSDNWLTMKEALDEFNHAAISTPCKIIEEEVDETFKS